MPNRRLSLCCLPVFTVLLLCHGGGSARSAAGDAGGLVSTMSLMAAVENVGGIRIVSAPDVPSKIYTEDLAPSQVLEIIRPDQRPITVGRLHSSCTCVQASLEKRHFGQGERALLEIRNVKPTPAEGAKYAVFVQLTSPVKETIQYDIFVQSRSKAAATGHVAHPGRPERPQPPARPQAPGRPEVARPITPTRPTPSQPAPVAKPPAFTYEEITPYRSRGE